MIRACIFDLGGTIVDRYSLTPLLSLKQVFDTHHLKVPDSVIFKDMGKNKFEHIKCILDNPIVQDANRGILKESHEIQDIYPYYDQFNIFQKINVKKYMDILPETRSTIDFLKSNDILIGATTGFNKEITALVKQELDDAGIIIDKYVSSTCLDMPGRPAPHMIHSIMNEFKIDSPQEVMKIDDTVVGIEEGRNANCWTVAVAKWSINMKITSIKDAYHSSEDVLEEKLKDSLDTLEDSNADYLIENLRGVNYIVDKFNGLNSTYFI